jgi:hypothetical protein
LRSTSTSSCRGRAFGYQLPVEIVLGLLFVWHACRLLRVEAQDSPGLSVALVQETVVETILAVLSELVAIRLDPVAAPPLRTRRIGGERLDGVLELGPVRERPALPRRNRPESAPDRPGGEVRVGFRGGDAFDRAVDPDLAARILPVEEQRCARIGPELRAFAALS